MSTNITVIGDGAMGTVTALILSSNGANVTLWGPHPENVAELIQTRRNDRYLEGQPIPDAIRITADDAKALDGTELIISAIPTQYLRKVWTRLKPHTPAPGSGVGVASLAKGIEDETGLRPTQVIADALDESGSYGKIGSDVRSLAAISGPSIASELARNLPATVCVAGDDEAFCQQIQKQLTTHWFRVYTNPDLLGVELAGATKNVIALAAGMLDGLQAGTNAKSALLARGLAEISRLGSAMGAQPETFFGIAGVGDLATTCFSPLGRNRTCGEELGKGRKLEEVLKTIPGVVEGVPTTRAVVKLAQQYGVDMPITQTIEQVLFAGLDPMDGIGQLMTRRPKAERVG